MSNTSQPSSVPLPKGATLHFIGIGGIGVSAVARIAIGRGFAVTGSDIRQSQLTEAMAALGARVHIGHEASNIDGADVVVVSTAIPDHNPELVAAKERGVALLHRSELLAAFLAETRSIGVTGTHGKGTTSAMITRILDAAGRDPGFIIGGMLNNFGTNARRGRRRVSWSSEVDESDGTHRNIDTDVSFLVVQLPRGSTTSTTTTTSSTSSRPWPRPSTTTHVSSRSSPTATARATAGCQTSSRGR